MPIMLGFLTIFGINTSVVADEDVSYLHAWGPSIGTQLPALKAQDQTGTWRDFESLKGKQGLLLFMNRSADW